jgi:hypothetical protein
MKINFRLRDAIFQSTKILGEPFPIYYKENIPQAMSIEELPLELPEVDKYLPTEDGEHLWLGKKVGDFRRLSPRNFYMPVLLVHRRIICVTWIQITIVTGFRRIG